MQYGLIPSELKSHLVSFNGASNFSWDYDNCMKASLTTSDGSSISSSGGGANSAPSKGLYYPYWDNNDNTCRNDGNQPTYSELYEICHSFDVVLLSIFSHDYL